MQHGPDVDHNMEDLVVPKILGLKLWPLEAIAKGPGGINQTPGNNQDHIAAPQTHE